MGIIAVWKRLLPPETTNLPNYRSKCSIYLDSNSAKEVYLFPFIPTPRCTGHLSNLL